MNGKSPPSPADDPLDRLARIREELKSVGDDEPDTGVTHIPTPVPPAVKGVLAFFFAIPPRGRVLVSLALVALLALVVWKLGPALAGVLERWLG